MEAKIKTTSNYMIWPTNIIVMSAYSDSGQGDILAGLSMITILIMMLFSNVREILAN